MINFDSYVVDIEVLTRKSGETIAQFIKRCEEE